MKASREHDSEALRELYESLTAMQRTQFGLSKADGTNMTSLLIDHLPYPIWLSRGIKLDTHKKALNIKSESVLYSMPTSTYYSSHVFLACGHVHKLFIFSRGENLKSWYIVLLWLGVAIPQWRLSALSSSNLILGKMTATVKCLSVSYGHSCGQIDSPSCPQPQCLHQSSQDNYLTQFY